MAQTAAPEHIDVRDVPKSQRHPLIIDAYRKLEVGTALILVNDHEPKNLRTEMESEFAEALGWEPLPEAGDGFRVRISKRAATPLPRVIVDVGNLDGVPESSGSVWQFQPQQRDLDANIIALAPGGEIKEHVGPKLDVLIHVLHGAGTLETELTALSLAPGQILWLPRLSRRRFLADETDGLTYFSVHQRKQGLSITSRP
ncbi:DUF2249 domain-containing protein [Brevibacterium marinum]|uniref:Uncharacterized protein (DUF2249 family)/quercetin dioxygenase-like cupin family protein n=1 Tax=Brevibacterium marinum TaxID=418643 RepID=A0A846S7I0_9MICO|nr:DUF2249 domain-containing protein [Brevibacterium marinum]NJC57352.1 uncharacterized protein (DUF2249 family)/quercetin dioxygenase-like cupin family protein [Brevibacterium marinum]